MTTSQMQIDGARMREEAIRLRRPLTLGEIQNLFGDAPETWQDGMCVPCHEAGVTENVDEMDDDKRATHVAFHRRDTLLDVVCAACAVDSVFVYLPDCEGGVCPVCDAREQAKPGPKPDPEAIAKLAATMAESLDEEEDVDAV